MARRAALAALFFASRSAASLAPAEDFYALKSEDIDGGAFEFSSLKGMKQVIILNVACQ